jgi:hypothetical protein
MIETLKLLWFDIKGYFIVRSILRKQKKTVDFNKFGLRVDWINRAYTVINPSEEDKGDSPDVLRIKAQNKMLPIHRYMDKVGLSEFVSVSVEPIPDEEDPSRVTDSYLLVYYPIFRVITTWRLIFTAIIFIAGAWAVIKFV